MSASAYIHTKSPTMENDPKCGLLSNAVSLFVPGGLAGNAALQFADGIVSSYLDKTPVGQVINHEKQFQELSAKIDLQHGELQRSEKEKHELEMKKLAEMQATLDQIEERSRADCSCKAGGCSCGIKCTIM
jgi:hypothetical protein